MKTINALHPALLSCIQAHYQLNEQQLAPITITLNVDKEASFGDLSCNAAMVLAKELKQNPRMLAQELSDILFEKLSITHGIHKIEIAGPGFLNIFLAPHVWQCAALELLQEGPSCFRRPLANPSSYLLEFVSANPTGPLHLGHGRGGIIGDVLANVLNFLGHRVLREYYINDAGSQITKLGASFRARYLQEIGQDAQLPEDGYAGDYLVSLAQTCVQEHGDSLAGKPNSFFAEYAKDALLARIKTTLSDYGITFDNWFSEKSLHTDGSIERVLEELTARDFAYEQDGALWFRSTHFGDDKDRVLRKSDGELTYIAADIAYHKNKFDRGYAHLINVLGQDHHGYVKRLVATMAALGYPAEKLDVILYQLVTLSYGDEEVRMSKRAGTFTKLSDIIEAVGKDVARFFYLNRKADAHLNFDLSVALKKTEENPAYYIQYAYVRCGSILAKAREHAIFDTLLDNAAGKPELLFSENVLVSADDISLLKKIAALTDVLHSIATNYQTHQLAYYVIELAQAFHAYYARNRVIDSEQPAQSGLRLGMVQLTHLTLGFCFDLLGISKPEKM